MTCVLQATETKWVVSRLVPGKEYYFSVRAANSAGKGNYSKIAGPFSTSSSAPRRPAPLKLIEVGSNFCVISIVLPYDNGSPIFSCVLRSRRLQGPLSDKERDDSGEISHELAEREDKFPPSALTKTADGIIAGATSDEKSSGVSFPSSDVELLYTLRGLLPGTDYELKWCAENEVGRGLFAKAVVMMTQPDAPDMPSSLCPGGDDGRRKKPSSDQVVHWQRRQQIQPFSELGAVKKTDPTSSGVNLAMNSKKAIAAGYVRPTSPGLSLA